ncbi:MAG: hypothetical protein RH982_07725 [Parvibaculum sp.]
MTARDFARLLIKLMGLLILAMTLVQLSQAVSYFPTYVENGSIFSALSLYLVPILFSVLVGWFLFKSDRLIADKMLFAEPGQDQPGTLNFEKTEEILISVLGIYLTASGLIGLARSLGMVLASRPNHSMLSEERLWAAYLIPDLVQVLVGLLVFLSSRGFVVLRRRFLDVRDKARELGIDK